MTPSTTLGGFTTEPTSLPVTAGQSATFQAVWSGLEPGARYLGWVGYEGALAPTVVSID